MLKQGFLLEEPTPGAAPPGNHREPLREGPQGGCWEVPPVGGQGRLLALRTDGKGQVKHSWPRSKADWRGAMTPKAPELLLQTCY